MRPQNWEKATQISVWGEEQKIAPPSLPRQKFFWLRSDKNQAKFLYFDRSWNKKINIPKKIIDNKWEKKRGVFAFPQTFVVSFHAFFLLRLCVNEEQRGGGANKRTEKR